MPATSRVRGLKEHRAGGDDAVRPVFPDTPGQLAPDGWGVYRLHQQLIGVRFPGYGGYPNNNRPLQSLNGRVVQLRRGRHED